jgi:hypothetical protein
VTVGRREAQAFRRWRLHVGLAERRLISDFAALVIEAVDQLVAPRV